MKHKVSYEWIADKSYVDTWAYQEKLQQALIQGKKSRSMHSVENLIPVVHHLLLCEHDPVYTLGRSGDIAHLLLSEETLNKQGVEFFKINRGGDITYHGPGQITGYPIFDLDQMYTDVHRYVRELEEVIIRSLKNWNVVGVRMPEYTGVWVSDSRQDGKFRKICAIGVHLSRWVTLHGFAFNVNTNLDYFNYIVPCGIREENLSVTSLEQELGKKVNLFEVVEVLKANFADIFQLEYQ